MKSLTRFLLVAALVLAPGCCTTRNADTGVSVESYVEGITKVRANIAEIRSDLIAADYDATIKEADVQLIDATITLCDDMLAGKNAGTAPAESGQ
jgi:hypothetical protein